MLKILEKFLQSRGLESPDQLDNTPSTDGSPNEREVFEKWRGILSKPTLSIEDLKVFLQAQVGMIENRWKRFDIDPDKKGNLIPYHTTYKIILAILDAPQAEREQLEAQLNQLIQ